jgi:hypothetical protein
MRLVKVTEPNDIATAFEKMSSTIKKQAVAREILISSQSGSDEVVAYWNQNLNFWSRFESVSNPEKIFCTFGIGEAKTGQNHTVTVETNLFKAGDSWAMSGSFAKDLEDKKIYLIHTGNISGKRSINMNRFLDWIPNGKRWTIYKTIKEVIIIGALEDDNFLEKLHDFLLDVEKFKIAMNSK